MRNIILIAPPRSRSSMVASIFRSHGWNTPTQSICAAYPMGKCENDAVGWILRPRGSPLKDYRTLLEQGPEAFRTTAKWEEIKPHLVEPWICKVDPFCLGSFEGADYKVVRVWRNDIDCLISNIEKDKRFTRKEWETILLEHSVAMDHIAKFNIDTDDLMGDEIFVGETLLIIDQLGYKEVSSLEKTLECIKEIPK